MEAEGKRFRRSFIGYNRTAVDEEFDRLLKQVDSMCAEQESMRGQISDLNTERDQLSRSVSNMSAQVVQLEQNLTMAQATADNLRMSVDAQTAEKNALIHVCDQLKARDREFSLREREFAELQSSVSSIMSVTKRATDRLFQRAADNQEHITQIAGDAAREVAVIRADMAQVRSELNRVLDELQDRIDRMDASFTNAVHKLVAIKHDTGLQPGHDTTTIDAEVERLLSMRAGEIDYAGGKNYAVPVLGPHSAKFLADTAHAVSDGKPLPESGDSEPIGNSPVASSIPPGSTIEVRRVNPSPFESTKKSISEANRLMNGAVKVVSQPAEPEPVPVPPAPSRIGFSADDEQRVIETGENITFECAETEPIAPVDMASGVQRDLTAMPIGDVISELTAPTMHYGVARSYAAVPPVAAQSAPAPVQSVPSAKSVGVTLRSRGRSKVKVFAVRQVRSFR